MWTMKSEAIGGSTARDDLPQVMHKGDIVVSVSVYFFAALKKLDNEHTLIHVVVPVIPRVNIPIFLPSPHVLHAVCSESKGILALGCTADSHKTSRLSMICRTSKGPVHSSDRGANQLKRVCCPLVD